MTSLNFSFSETDRDAFRLALQSSFAAGAFYALAKAFHIQELFVGVISAVLIVQPSLGSTLWAGADRLISTIVGCLIGIGCLAILPQGYGTVVALAVSMFVMNISAGYKPEWRYGVVSAVALSLGTDNDLLQTSLDRSLSIGVAVVVGILTTLLIWPDTANARVKRHLKSALLAAKDRLDTVTGRLVGDSDEPRSQGREAYHRAISNAREASEVLGSNNDGTLGSAIDTAEHLYNSVLFLSRVTERLENPIGDTNGIGSQLKDFRACASETIQRIVEGKDDYEVSFQNLTSIAEEISAFSVDSIRNEHTGSLQFALEEIRQDLEDLSKQVETFTARTR